MKVEFSSSAAEPAQLHLRVFSSCRPISCALHVQEALHSRFEAIAEQSAQLSSLLDGACSEAGGPRFPLSEAEAQCALDISAFAQLPEMVRQELLWRFVANGCGSMLSYPGVRAIATALATKPAEPFTWPLGSGWQLSRAGTRLFLSQVEETEDQAWAVDDLLVVRNCTPSLSLKVVRAGLENQTASSTQSSSSFLLHNLRPKTTITLRGAKPGDRFCPGPSSRARAIKLTYFLHREGKACAKRPKPSLQQPLRPKPTLQQQLEQMCRCLRKQGSDGP